MSVTNRIKHPLPPQIDLGPCFTHELFSRAHKGMLFSLQSIGTLPCLYFGISGSFQGVAIFFSLSAMARRIGLYKNRFRRKIRMRKLMIWARTVNQLMSTIYPPALDRK